MCSSDISNIGCCRFYFLLLLHFMKKTTCFKIRIKLPPTGISMTIIKKPPKSSRLTQWTIQSGEYSSIIHKLSHLVLWFSFLFFSFLFLSFLFFSFLFCGYVGVLMKHLTLISDFFRPFHSHIIYSPCVLDVFKPVLALGGWVFVVDVPRGWMLY